MSQPSQRSVEVGDRVEILIPLAPLKHRQRVTGRVTGINGSYVYVRPSWCKWEAELYPGELRVL